MPEPTPVAPRSLRHYLERSHNNLDVFRLIAALAVIVGHSYVLAPAPGERDVVARLVGFTYSGALAVKVFFFLSGLVCANSLLDKRGALAFVVARVFRIFPALIFTLIVTVFVVGPLASALASGEYFGHKQTWRYLVANGLLRTEYHLPGVFLANPYAKAVNGSLWTLRHEVGAYLGLLAGASLGLLYRRWVATVICALVIADALLPAPLLLRTLGKNPEIRLLPSCFAAGALLAVQRDVATPRARWALAGLPIFLLCRTTHLAEPAFLAVVFALLLWLGGTRTVLSARMPADFSYGVYLWGFPVAQLFASRLAAQGPLVNCVATILGVLPLSVLSWYVVEKPAIHLGKRLVTQLGWSPRPRPALAPDPSP